jgi:hypothetical protein
MPKAVGRLVKQNEERLSQIGEVYGMSRPEVVNMLLDIYDLEDVDLITSRIRDLYASGMQPKQLRQLTILQTQLAALLKPLLY